MQVYLLTDTWFYITLPYMFIVVDFKALHTIYFKDVLMQSPRKDKRMQDFHQAASISRLSTSKNYNKDKLLSEIIYLLDADFLTDSKPSGMSSSHNRSGGVARLYSFLKSGQPA